MGPGAAHGNLVQQALPDQWARCTPESCHAPAAPVVPPTFPTTGLRLTNQLLMYMAKQGMCNMPHVVCNILDCGVPSSADAIYVSAASGDIMDTMQVRWYVCLQLRM